MNPLISVIMPVYNAEKHLRLAMDSMLRQTYPHFELIIIDDCSTDNTPAILDSYKDARIVRVRNERNMGIVGAMNRGMALAKGDYIARMDADDIAFEGRFAEQIAYLEANPEVGLLGTRYIHIDDEGEYVYHGIAQPPEAEPGTPGYLKWSLLWMTSVQHPTAMMRRAVLQAHNLRYDDAFFTAEDYDLWTRISHVCDVARLHNPQLLYRVTSTGISVTKRQRQLATHFNITYREVCRMMGDVLPEDLMLFIFRVMIPQDIDPHELIRDVDIAAAVDLLVRIRETFILTTPLKPAERAYVESEVRRIMLKTLSYTRYSQDKRTRFAIRARIFRESPSAFITLSRQFVQYRLSRIFKA